jgi:hypothetical protein
VALRLERLGFDVAPLAGGLARWRKLELPLEERPPEALPQF